MSMSFQPPSLIGATNTTVSNTAFMDRLDSARAAGALMQYEYKNVKPKKQLKEIIKVLKPECKTFLKVPYKFKYNIKDRCVVCGTYCEKHAGIHRQYEYLEQQILAEEHGLSFSAYIPKAPSLNPLAAMTGPMTTLKQADILSLTSVGWVVKPPNAEIETGEEEMFRLLIESDAISERLKVLLTEGSKIPVSEESEGEA